MNSISSIVGKRSLSIAVARNITAIRFRPIDTTMFAPLSSLVSPNHTTFQDRCSQSRSMVMVTHTRTSGEADASINSSAASSIKASESANVAFTNPENQEQSVFVTQACYKRIHHLISLKKRQDLYLRVFVDAGGCSGFTYQFEIDSDENLKLDDDVVFTESSTDCNGGAPARVVVDKGSLQLIAGSKIDYVQEMIKSSFEVRENPQSESACGCGSSFALKNFASNPPVD